jgi:hypothetical protein
MLEIARDTNFLFIVNISENLVYALFVTHAVRTLFLLHMLRGLSPP